VTLAAISTAPSQPSPWASVQHGLGRASEVTSSTMSEVLKPYFTLACVAFVMGFAAYLALGWMMTPAAPPTDDWQASISAPMTPADAPLARAKTI